MKKLILFLSAFLILASPCFGQWAVRQWGGSPGIGLAAEDEEAPGGLLLGVGTDQFDFPSIKSALIYRISDRISVAGKWNMIYNDDNDKLIANPGLGMFWFIDGDRNFYLRGDYIPELEKGEHPEWETIGAGFGYAARDGQIPLTGINLGIPYFIDIAQKRDLESGDVRWEYHLLWYIEF